MHFLLYSLYGAPLQRCCAFPGLHPKKELFHILPFGCPPRFARKVLLFGGGVCSTKGVGHADSLGSLKCYLQQGNQDTTHVMSSFPRVRMLPDTSEGVLVLMASSRRIRTHEAIASTPCQNSPVLSDNEWSVVISKRYGYDLSRTREFHLVFGMWLFTPHYA